MKMKKVKKLHVLLAALLLTLLIPVCKPTIVEAATLKAPKTLTVRQGKGNVTVQWSRVSGAKGYIIYRKNSPSQGWKRLKVVKAPTLKYLDKRISSGKSYYYTVRPYTTKSGKNSYGAYNKSGKNIIYLKEPVVKAIRSYNSVLLKWNKVIGAAGYKIYCSNGNISWLVNTTTELSYMDNSLLPSTKYWFTVIAYKKVGKTTYSCTSINNQNRVSIKTLKTPVENDFVNSSIDSKVFVSTANGVIELHNKTKFNFYGIQYSIDFYDSKNELIYRIPKSDGSSYLAPEAVDYYGFSIPKQLVYSTYKVKLNIKDNFDLNYYIKNLKWRQYIKTSHIYSKNNIYFIDIANSSSEVLRTSLKYVVFDNAGIPITVIKDYSRILNIKETGTFQLPMQFLPMYMTNGYKIKVLVNDTYLQS